MDYLYVFAVSFVVSLLTSLGVWRFGHRKDPVAAAVSYAEQLGGTGEEKLRHAVQALQKFRKVSDARARVLIEAELNSREEE